MAITPTYSNLLRLCYEKHNLSPPQPVAPKRLPGQADRKVGMESVLDQVWLPTHRLHEERPADTPLTPKHFYH